MKRAKINCEDKINFQLENYFFKSDTLILYFKKMKTYYKLKSKFCSEVEKRLLKQLIKETDFAINNQLSNVEIIESFIKHLNILLDQEDDYLLHHIYADVEVLLENLTLSLGDNEKYFEDSKLKYKLGKKSIFYSGNIKKENLETNKKNIKKKQLQIQNKINMKKMA